MTRSENKRNVKWLKAAYILYPAVAVISNVMPFVVKHFANKYLAKLNGYDGHIAGVHFSVGEIMITVKGVDVKKRLDGKNPVPFIESETVTVHVDRDALWQGELIVELTSESPIFTFHRTHFSYPKIEGNPLLKLDLGMDLTLKRLEINKGDVKYVDSDISPALILEGSNVHLLASNISTKPVATIAQPVAINLKAKVYQGVLTATLRSNVLKESPDFNLTAEMCGLDLVPLNPLFTAYGKFDLNSGMMNLLSEVSAANGSFNGFVESEIQGLDFLGPEDKKDTILQVMWEGFLGAVATILENRGTDEIATRLPFDGTFKNPKVHIGYAVVEVLSNAFFHGLRSSINCEVDIQGQKEKDKK